MAEATEIVFLPLKQASDAQASWFTQTLEMILKQGGSHRMYQGGHPDVQNLFIDWSSIDHHMNLPIGRKLMWKRDYGCC